MWLLTPKTSTGTQEQDMCKSGEQIPSYAPGDQCHAPGDQCHHIRPSHVHLALFPGPRPAFRRLQYGKAGWAWYVSSREHYVIDKRPKFSERKSEVLRIVQPATRSMLGVYDSCPPPLAKYVW